jgi:D-alanyl-D-alanine dipeptidase
MNVTTLLSQAIPLSTRPETNPAWPTIHECAEPLLPLTGLSERIHVYPYYAMQGYPGALPECYLRKSAAIRLVQAAESLPPGYKLVVLDGWRPYQVQLSLYEGWKQHLLDQGWQEGEALRRELTKYVAYPSENPERPPRHLTGGAVDLTISDADGWLDMGTDFDDFSPRAATRFFEELDDSDERTNRIRRNRRLLYHVMITAGFTNYSEEWWHYDYGNQAWASIRGTTAIYGGIFRHRT